MTEREAIEARLATDPDLIQQARAWALFWNGNGHETYPGIGGVLRALADRLETLTQKRDGLADASDCPRQLGIIEGVGQNTQQTVSSGGQ